MKKSRLLGAVCACVLGFTAIASQAEMITYTVEADINLQLGTDDYNLDGAHLIWTTTVDGSASPSSVTPGPTGEYVRAQYYMSDPYTFTITNRANSEPDIIFSGNMERIYNRNGYTSTWFDWMTLVAGNITEPSELDGLNVSGFFRIIFTDHLFWDQLGAAPIGDPLIQEAIESVGIDSWYNNSATVYYDFENITAYTSAVPTPPACDINDDGEVNLGDLLLLQRHLLGY